MVKTALFMWFQDLGLLSSALGVDPQEWSTLFCPQEWSTLFCETRVFHRNICQLDWADGSVNSMGQIVSTSPVLGSHPAFYVDDRVQVLCWQAGYQLSNLPSAWTQPKVYCTFLHIQRMGQFGGESFFFFFFFFFNTVHRGIWVYLGCWWGKMTSLLLHWCHHGGQGAVRNSSARMF
jgi:hypothetical protein